MIIYVLKGHDTYPVWPLKFCTRKKPCLIPRVNNDIFLFIYKKVIVKQTLKSNITKVQNVQKEPFFFFILGDELAMKSILNKYRRKL